MKDEYWLIVPSKSPLETDHCEGPYETEEAAQADVADWVYVETRKARIVKTVAEINYSFEWKFAE